MYGAGKKPSTEPMLMMRPPPWCRMCGTTARVIRTIPKKFVSKIKRACSIELSSAPAGAEESSIEQARLIFDTNFFGIVRMTRAVVPHMRHQGGGRIINIGSVLGFLPAPYMALYAATKHAVEGYSESLDHEVRTWCIRVSVIEPAYTKTHFEANLLEPDATLDEYREARATVSRQVRAVLETADEPGVVADVVLEAARADRPKLRYPAGGLANRLRLLRRFAPAGAVDAGIRRNLRLDAPVASPPATKVLGCKRSPFVVTELRWKCSSC